MEDYRTRVYGQYVRARQETLAPQTLAGLGSRAPYLKNLIRDHFPSNSDAIIFEVGCGHGALIHFANEAGYKNSGGVDRSSQQVAEAHRLGIDGVTEGDLMRALEALPDGSLDVLVAFDVMEHFTKSEVVRFVDQAVRVLRQGGRWIIHAPNGESPFVGRAFYGDFTHETAFTSGSLAQLLKSSGFSDVKSYEDAPIVHGVKSGLRAILWMAIRNFLRLYLAVETGSGRGIFSQNFLTVAVK